jgi:flagellar assembly protein FliH
MSFTRHQAVGAYRRWIPPAFDAPPPPAPAEKPAHEPGGGAETAEAIAAAETHPTEAHPTETRPTETRPGQLPPGVRLPTVNEIEQIHDEARRSGFDAGFAEGRAAGHAEGVDAGMKEGRETGFAEGRQTGLEEGRQNGYASGKIAAVNEIARLRELFVNLECAMTRLDADVGEELMALAIEIARKVIQHTLAVTPDAIRGVVRAALAQLPQGKAELRVNPADLALIRKHLDETAPDSGNYLLVADDAISPGGCRIDAEGAQLDVTLETRWQRVLDSLGSKHSPWIAQPRATAGDITAEDIPAATPADENAAAALDPPPDEAPRSTAEPVPAADEADESGTAEAASAEANLDELLANIGELDIKDDNILEAPATPDEADEADDAGNANPLPDGDGHAEPR